MKIEQCWISHPQEWQPKLEQWAREFPGRLSLHAWPQFCPHGAAGQQVTGLTLGDDGRERPIRLLVAVPHAHEPAPTAAVMDLASQLLTGRRADGTAAGTQEPNSGLSGWLEHGLLTLLPDTNSQGRARSPRRVWDGEVDNEEFLKVAFGEAADGERFGRYPEWRLSEHQPRRVGIIYEQMEPDLFVEPNTSRRSTHSRALDELFARYRYTHYLEMHQHEGDEAALLPAEYDDLPADQQSRVTEWAEAVLAAWEAAGIRHKGSYVPYRGQPRLQLFREFWAGRFPGMLHLSTETRNNRHSSTGERTSMAHQFRSASAALLATLDYLTDRLDQSD
jgi:hypothetical protein